MSQMGRTPVLFSVAGVPVPVTRETLWAWRRDGTEDLVAVAVRFILQKGMWKPRDAVLVTLDEVLR